MGKSKSIVNKKMQYIRKETYSVKTVYNAIKCNLFDDKEVYVDIDGDKIKANSQRYQTFFTKGIKCCCCGIEGKYFAKEKNPNAKKYHLNLYAIDKNGKEVMMTKDHIIPISKGGKSVIENYQTMCEKCNVAKGNKLM